MRIQPVYGEFRQSNQNQQQQSVDQNLKQKMFKKSLRFKLIIKMPQHNASYFDFSKKKKMLACFVKKLKDLCNKDSFYNLQTILKIQNRDLKQKQLSHKSQNKMDSYSPPSTNSISSQQISSFSHQQSIDHLSVIQTNLSSINTFLNSYQILKKWEKPIIDIKPHLQKQKANQFNSPASFQGLSKANGYHGSSVGILTKDNPYLHMKKQQDEISEKIKTKQGSNSIREEKKDSQLMLDLKIPADNDLIALHSHIKCSNLLTRVRSLNNSEDINQRPMFMYPEWKQVSQGVKKIFNKVLQCPMKQLNTGTLLSVRPKQSLSIRTDYYCFHPHQVYTTFLALDKTTMNNGTFAFCRLQKQFIDNQFVKYINEYELLDSINKEKKQVQWEYIELKQGDLVIIGKDVLYGSFRNDSQSTKFFAQMRWVRHESASNSSNSS